ncbi:biotin synthase [Rickettsia felis str. Pedreira]|uniref:Biotin synthase n=2 Tax=Rickettsia felis TaxID=42862 RepID=BIOB_RICFE|nr:biotin synthase BioB [Rickettsia felis]Q4UM45.1 RecName: Full=Biotin synthase [Rickettsia felis URRWXCal2]AAY61378.1 Biotin synthase [Rickettsia felis URRWXCal2]KHO02859.1 biotin synthase [Rickettsia felis str. LSU]KHO03814.1 biotin synthase [Rickettsia felis]KJV57945.1 biotin synthase [Rickettsia felis str. Pedreira]MDE8611067.1 biotin synthase BioB [Rickettsia felis]
MKKWTFDEAKEIFSFSFMELVYQAQTIHRANFDPNKIQISSLLSIKTGSCPENCKFCPQSSHYKTYVKKEPLMQIEDVITAAKRAKAAGSTRFCMGAAWRGPRDEDLKLVCEMIKEVKKLGLETCVTLGLLKEHQAVTLKEAGLDFYNHNIDTSEEFYNKIITTRTFQDRLDTLRYVRASGMKVCCGGILGMGETNDDRINMILTLANLEEPAESVTINKLIKIPGTPLENVQDIDPFDFVRVIALARIMIPKSYIRLSAGREQMSDELQALCIMAGVYSIFYGEKILTSANPMPERDNDLFQKLGIIH